MLPLTVLLLYLLGSIIDRIEKQNNKENVFFAAYISLINKLGMAVIFLDI
jgi:hypothetical protein